jgi:hypothetical protein
MNERNNTLRDYIELKDYNSINDFLIESSKSPNAKDLKYIDILLNVPDLEFRKNYILNLVFYLGELGKSTILDEKYVIFMKNIYFQSDRWVRNEILTTILKFMLKTKLNEDIFTIIRNAITDEYLEIKLNAIRIINQVDNIPEDIALRVLLNFGSNNSELISYSSRIIKKNVKSNQILINLLKKLYDINPNLEIGLIRNLLINLFESVLELEHFREDLSESELAERFKQKFLNEIKIMQKILLKIPNR